MAAVAADLAVEDPETRSGIKGSGIRHHHVLHFHQNYDDDDDHHHHHHHHHHHSPSSSSSFVVHHPSQNSKFAFRSGRSTNPRWKCGAVKRTCNSKEDYRSWHSSLSSPPRPWFCRLKGCDGVCCHQRVVFLISFLACSASKFMAQILQEVVDVPSCRKQSFFAFWFNAQRIPNSDA